MTTKYIPNNITVELAIKRIEHEGTCLSFVRGVLRKDSITDNMGCLLLSCDDCIFDLNGKIDIKNLLECDYELYKRK